MERFSQEIKSEIDQIPIPKERLDATVRKALEVGQQQERKRSSRMQKWKVNIASILVLGILTVLLQATLLNSENTQGQAYEDSPLYKYGDAGIKKVVEEGRVEKLSLSAEDNGITLNLKEAYFDHSQLVIGYEVLADRTINSNLEYKLMINDDPTTQSHGVMGFDGPIEDGTIEFTGSKYFPADAKIDLELKLKDLELKLKDPEEASWSFAFDLKKEEAYDEKNVNIYAKALSDHSFGVKRIKKSPSKLSVETQLKIPEEERMKLSKDTFQEFLITTKNKNGVHQIQDPISSMSPHHLTDTIMRFIPYTMETILVPNDTIETYTIIPYLYSIGNSKVQSLKPGTTLHPNNSTILKVTEVKNQRGDLVVRMETPSQTVNWPINELRVFDKDDNWYRPSSYVQRGAVLEVHFPNVSITEDLKIHYSKVTHFFEELAVEVEL
ncbi:DUF4179 domain-containing protein [Sutcliffiella halmapala]|uniref:DUF4179 domain-containing protein n=1 Tax=Sutcliffiella halmapala TaxID=79882 RepID=UPI00099509CC|nr:DUF4179 domain-containing protein [Sutcliffiella halmapala]